MTGRISKLSAALAMTALVLGGCSGDDSAATGSTGGKQAGDSRPGVEDRQTKAIVEQTVVPDPESPEDKTTVGITSRTVEGETTVLRLVVTPDFASVSDSDKVDLGEAMNVGGQFFGVSLRLLDRKNLKEYSVISEGNKWWASASSDVSALNGEPMYAFAVFAAPEDDIGSVDVRLNENWPEFTEVAITR